MRACRLKWAAVLAGKAGFLVKKAGFFAAVLGMYYARIYVVVWGVYNQFVVGLGVYTTNK